MRQVSAIGRVPLNANWRSSTGVSEFVSTPDMPPQEGQQLAECLVRVLFRQEVARIDANAGHVHAPGAPSGERLGLDIRALLDRAHHAALSPESECRTNDLAAVGAVRFIEGEVACLTGAVVVAGRMDVLWGRVVEAVFRERILIEGGEVLAL